MDFTLIKTASGQFEYFLRRAVHCSSHSEPTITDNRGQHEAQAPECLNSLAQMEVGNARRSPLVGQRTRTDAYCIISECVPLLGKDETGR